MSRFEKSVESMFYVAILLLLVSNVSGWHTQFYSYIKIRLKGAFRLRNKAQNFEILLFYLKRPVLHQMIEVDFES